MEASTIMLTTGETLISQLQEYWKEKDDGSKDRLCLELIHPYELTIVSQDEEKGSQVKFSRWMPMSSDFKFKIPFNAILTVGKPQKDIMKAYERKVEEAEKLIEDAKPKPRQWASDVSVIGAGMGG